MAKFKKYECCECYAVVKIQIVSLDNDTDKKLIQFCPLCSDYLDEWSDDIYYRDPEEPLLNSFEDYDEYDDDLDE